LIRDVPHILDYPRARQDEAYIDLAAASDATHLVSRDRDLLDLATDHALVAKEFRQRFPGLSILTPVAFLSVVRG
jgi:predicted nucleic acid-binding protein